MSTNSGLKIIFGGGFFGHENSVMADAAGTQVVLDKLTSLGIKIIDTAQIYSNGKSESLLGDVGAGKTFTIDTKNPGGAIPGLATETGVLEAGLGSLERLKMDKVDVYYIHAPDTSTPLSSTLAGINALYKRGGFARFGLSNYTPEQVEEVYNHCKANGYVLPSVYQGNYNPVARNYEKTLFPLLRKLGIAFYAYSPIAGGFLAKSKQQVLEGIGRFNKDSMIGQMYNLLYAKPALLEALGDWEQAAKEEGCSGAELAYRWVSSNSALSPQHGDGIIIGGRNVQQTEEAFSWLQKASISEKAIKAIDAIWEKTKHEAPTTNFEVADQLKT